MTISITSLKRVCPEGGVGKIAEKKKSISDIPFEVILNILNFLEPKDVFNFALTSRSYMAITTLAMGQKVLYEKYEGVLKRLKYLVATLSEKERKKAIFMERLIFPEPYIAKLRNSEAKVFCIQMKFLRERSEERLCSKATDVLEESLGLSRNNLQVIAKDIVHHTSIEETCYCLCLNILTQANKKLSSINALSLGASEIKDVFRKSEAQESLSKCYHKSGHLVEAVEIARKIVDPGLKSLRLQEISTDYGDGGDVNYARELLKESLTFAREIIDPDTKSTRLKEISVRCQLWDDLETALAAAKWIPDDSIRSVRVAAIESLIDLAV